MTNTALYLLLKSKLAAGGGGQVQSDWAQTNSAAIDYIKNKPQEVTEDEFLSWLTEESVVTPTASASGELYTTNKNEIYIL